MPTRLLTNILHRVNYRTVFTYLNPEIRERLIQTEKLIRIDAKGAILDARQPPSPDSLALNLLGPIPLPLGRGQKHPTVHWYAAVRSTELSEVETLARSLSARLSTPSTRAWFSCSADCTSDESFDQSARATMDAASTPRSLSMDITSLFGALAYNTGQMLLRNRSSMPPASPNHGTRPDRLRALPIAQRQDFRAMASISTSPPFGSSATAIHARAGR